MCRIDSRLLRTRPYRWVHVPFVLLLEPCASDVCMKCRAAVMPLDAVLNMAACKASASLLQDWGKRAAAVADSRAELLYGPAV